MKSNSVTLNTSRAFRFKEYLIHEIEKILQDRPTCIDDTITRIKIVDVIFAFKNSILVRDLI